MVKGIVNYKGLPVVQGPRYFRHLPKTEDGQDYAGVDFTTPMMESVMEQNLKPFPPLAALREGQYVVVCEHLIIPAVAWAPSPWRALRQDPPVRILRQGGGGLLIDAAVLCSLCELVSPRAGDDMFLAIIRDGKPVPAR